MCLRDHVIENDDGDIGTVRQASELRNDNGGGDRGRGIYDASEGLYTTADMAGAKLWARGIYENDGGVGRGI